MSQLAARQAANQLAKENAPVDIAPLFSLNRRRLIAEAEAVHGRWLVYPLPGPGRTKVPTWGLVEYLGEKQYPRCLRVHYPTGQQHDVTLRLVRKHLQGMHSKPPQSVLDAVPSLVVQNAAVSTQGPTLAPVGVVPLPLAGHLSWPDLLCLAQVINMQCVHSIVDPLNSGMSSLLPDFTAMLRSQRHCLAPSAAPVLSGSAAGDIAILAVQSRVSLPQMLGWCECAPCVCIKLEGDQLHALPIDVQRWLQQLQQQRRLQVIVGTTQVYAAICVPHACTWLCVFSEAITRNAMVPPYYRTPSSLAFVALGHEVVIG
jgi:hypothetical protein